jgi:hypothetical protein
MLNQINLIPDVVWSGLIASTITLLGVFVMNLGNDSRLRLQLKHDSNEKERVRAADLRRDVFLPAAEELIKAMNFLGGLPNSDLTKINPMEGVQGFFAASAKLHLVADERTAGPVTEFSAAFGQLSLRVIAKIVPLQTLRNEIHILDGLYEKSQADANRVLSEKGRMVEAGNNDRVLFELLGKAFEMHQVMATGYAQERTEKWKNYNELMRQFVLFLMTEMKAVSQLYIPLLVALRRDLGFNTDTDLYSAQLEKQHQSMSVEMDKVYAVLDAATEPKK